MGYSASAEPRNAPNQSDTALRSATMSRRPCSEAERSRRKALDAARKAILEFDITCTCKASLIVSCAVGAEPGCRERRRDGTCGCKPRWLPTCILERSTPHGCPVWREGKTCACPRMYMPQCLVTGCDLRQRGKRCECPRTPTELCPHIVAKIQEFTGLTPAAANRMADVWAEQLWALLPEAYADHPLASRGVTTRSREARVNLLSVRNSEKLGYLSLWHPDDEVCFNALVLHKQAAGLKRLMGTITGSKKGSAA